MFNRWQRRGAVMKRRYIGTPSDALEGLPMFAELE